MTRAILFDRDGTLIVDRPGNGDPASVELMPFAAEAVALAREHGLRVAVITNQPALGRGEIGEAAMLSIHERIESMTGAIDGWFVCPHRLDDGCSCRKPMPGLIAQASRQLNVDPQSCVVVGDIGSDVDAALAIGARAVLVPTAVTLQNEVDAAPAVAENVLEAVRCVVEGRL